MQEAGRKKEKSDKAWKKLKKENIVIFG